MTILNVTIVSIAISISNNMRIMLNTSIVVIIIDIMANMFISVLLTLSNQVLSIVTVN